MRRTERIAQLLVVLVLGLATTGLVGWVSNRWQIASLHPAYIPMAPSTALAFVALGGAILALTGWPGHRLVRRGAWVTALLVALVAVLILPRALFGVGPDIENVLYRNPELFLGVPVARMSPLTALGFLCGSLALLTLLYGRPLACEAAVGLSSGAGVIGLIALAGYWYGTPLLYGGTMVPMALPTAAAMTLLGLSLFATIGRQARLLRAVTGPSITARLLRAFIPAIAVFALAHLLGDAIVAPGLGGQDAMLRVALVSLGAMVVFGGATVFITRQIGGALDRAEAGRQQAEAALRASEERYRTTLTSIGDGVIATDAEGRVTLVNPVAEQLTGWSQQAACGRPLAEVFRIIHEHTRQPVEDPVARVLREGQVVGLANHTLLITREGVELPIADSGAPICSAQGELLGVVLVFRDQTAERAAAATLRESEQRFRLLYEQSPVAYQSLDADGYILDVNDAWLTELGYAQAEVVGRWFGDFLAGDDARFPERFAEFKARGKVHDVEWTLRHKDGSEIEVLLRGQAGQDMAGGFGQTYCVFVNITERKRAETALQASEARFRELFNNISSGVAVYDAVEDGRDFVIRDFNYAAQQIEKISKQKILNHRVTEVFPGVRDMGLLEVFQRVWRTGQPKRCDAMAYHDERITGWRENRVYKLPSGELVAVYDDVSERRRAEAALRESEARLQIAKSAADLGIYDHDVRSGTIQWDLRVRELWGIGPDEPVTYDTFLAGLHPADYAATRSALDRAMDPASGGRYNAEYRVISLSDGVERWVAATGQAFFEEDCAVRVVGTLQDITERKQAEERLRDTVVQLERSNADLEQFAHVASHDLQEPLRMVASYVQLLAMRYRGQLDADADAFIGFAVDGAKRMQQLLLALLEYSRVGTRGQQLAITEIESVLLAALDDLQLAVADVGASVTHDALPVVMCDAAQLRQIFQNLIGNAIKFRGVEPPHIHIGARRAGDFWQFSVRDNGIGIDPEYFERIFIIFQRLHTRETYPGIGIGLAICKRIVDRHGGRIWVESQPGQGAMFYFTLPA